ncbi:MAG TPA: hypothetical protein VME22_15635 [Solirubrobacteraceae bacterium]|nr:hypothetical protein [Solirubrobacteraceae bacterium]
MTNYQPPSITREELDEFIRQLFVCHWVLGQMIAGMLERAWSEPDDGDQDLVPDDHYSLIRRAIAEVVNRHGAQRIKEATELIDEVMDAISDDTDIFPGDEEAEAIPLLDLGSQPGTVHKRRR